MSAVSFHAHTGSLTNTKEAHSFVSKHNYILWIKKKELSQKCLNGRFYNKKNVPDVLVDLEEAFFNDLMRACITETSLYKRYPRFPPNI